MDQRRGVGPRPRHSAIGLPSRRIEPITRLVLLSGKAPDVIAAEWLERRDSLGAAASPGFTAGDGAHIVEIGGCKVCPHEDLSGGRHPLALPNEPTPSSLRPDGPLSAWSEGHFIRTLRTGTTPDGRRLDEQLMPWQAFNQMTDLEPQAIWHSVRSLPRAPNLPASGRTSPRESAG